MTRTFWSFLIIIICSIRISKQQLPPFLKKFRDLLCTGSQQNFSNNWPSELGALNDVLPQICSYLDAGDLCTVQTVCRDFRDAAWMETNRRRGPELKVLPVKNMENDLNYKRLRNILTIKPRIALFFTDHSNIRLFYNSLSKELISHYLPEMPKYSPLLHLVVESVSIDGGQRITAQNNAALGLFLHDSMQNGREIVVRTGTMNEFESMENPNPIKSSISQTFLKTTLPKAWHKFMQRDQHFAYLLFNLKANLAYMLNDYYDPINTKLLKTFGNLYEQKAGKFAIWGGEITALSSTGVYTPSTIDMEVRTFGMSIAGNGIQAWSLMIDASIPKNDIDKKLQAFRSNMIESSGSQNFDRSVILTLMTKDRDSGADTYSWISKLFSKYFKGIKNAVEITVKPSAGKYCVDSWKQPEDIESRIIRHVKMEVICYLFLSYL